MAEAENYSAWLLARAGGYLGARVLDVGAGIGTFAALLGEQADVVAVEPDPAFVSLLRGRFDDHPNVQVVEGDAFSNGIDGPFDTIVALNVLEHISDDRGTLRRLRDLLGAGGHLLLLVPAHPFLLGRIDRSVGHERRYTRHDLTERLRDAGLDVDEIHYVNPVGALGWLLSSKVLRRTQVPGVPLKLYDSLVPLLRRLDRFSLPFGLSVWAVARRPPS
jgi:SAM-dependent methyltransferase